MTIKTMRRAGLALFAAFSLSACAGLSDGDAGGSSSSLTGYGASDGSVSSSGLASGGVMNGGIESFGVDPAEMEHFRTAIGDRVLFSTDSSQLDITAMETLRAQAAWLRAHPQATATIEGHADERGTREYNLALGARRAAAVRNFLVAEGVSPDALRSATYGKERPEAACSAERCWSINRRVVTVMPSGPGV